MVQNITSIITSMLVAAFLAVSANAATITVNTLVDENNTNAAACSLREAIINANNDSATNGSGCVAGAGTDDIVFSVNGTITLTSVLPTITTSMNVNGGNSSLLTITGNDASRVFVINGSGTVTLANITVTNGFDAVQGGGILNIGAAVTTLSGITVTNSRSPQGGGVQNDATMTINNSIISNNQATSKSGGIANFGTLTVNNSTISNNSATTDSGGIGSNNNLTVTDSTFTGNAAVNGVGGAILSTGGTLLSVTRSTFIGNSGGALIITSTTTSQITNSTFFNNTSAAAFGSAVNSSMATTLTNCTITGNRGANAVIVSNGSTAFVNNIISGNTNADGTIQTDIATTSGTIDGANSFNNIVGTDSSNTLTNGVNGNQVGVSIANVRILPPDNYGGAVQTMPIRTHSPARNAGRNTGAPTTDARGYSRAQGASVDIGAFEIQTNSIVTNTNNTGTGSLRNVVAAVPASEIVQFENPLFYASPQTISLSTGRLNIGKNLTIYGNGANLLTVQNTLAASGTSSVIQIFDVSKTVVLNGMTITGGNTTTAGGGILISGGGNAVTVTGCHVTGNTATNAGGGISIANGNTVTVLNSTISNNISNSTDTGGGGSGISSTSSTLNLINSTISGNTKNNGNNNGGGIWNSGTATITNSTITNNSATAGANRASGIYNSVDGTTTVRNSIIAANQNNSTITDVDGIFTSSGFNIVGNRGTVTTFNQTTDKSGTSANPLNPMLTPLGNFGGTTPTHAFTSRFSPAVDAGNASGETLDQRGLARTFDNPNIANVSDGTDIGAYESLTTTAAGINIGGRVLTSKGKGLTNAIVTLTTANGATRTTLTSFNGRFSFADVANGETVILSVKSKRYQFGEQALSANEDVNNVNFIAQ